MFFLFGTKEKLIYNDSGKFYCPICRKKYRKYTIYKRNRYFTVFFLCLFRTKKLGKILQCQSCKNYLPVDVLDMDFFAAPELIIE